MVPMFSDPRSQTITNGVFSSRETEYTPGQVDDGVCVMNMINKLQKYTKREQDMDTKMEGMNNYNSNGGEFSTKLAIL